MKKGTTFLGVLDDAGEECRWMESDGMRVKNFFLEKVMNRIEGEEQREKDEWKRKRRKEKSEKKEIKEGSGNEEKRGEQEVTS